MDLRYRHVQEAEYFDIGILELAKRAQLAACLDGLHGFVHQLLGIHRSPLQSGLENVELVGLGLQSALSFVDDG